MAASSDKPSDPSATHLRLTNNTDTTEIETTIVSAWIQTPLEAEILQFEIFDNVTRRVADRGTVMAIAYKNDEMFYMMGTVAQAHRVFTRLNNVWIMESTIFIRCTGYHNITRSTM